MTTDAFEKVSGVIGNAMNEAWVKIISDLADIAKGAKSPSHLLVTGGANVLSLDDIREFFECAGGAHLDITFPCVVAKDKIDLFQAQCVDHGIPSRFMSPGLAATRISGTISIGVGISF